MTKLRLLILGGTTEARALAERLKDDPRFEAMISLAGRTVDPKPQPVATRIGGFGGAAGLAGYLSAEGIDMVVDATHPFASQMSRNAAEAAGRTGVPLLALTRPAWTRQDGDHWISVRSVVQAVAALGQVPRRVFLAIGRQEAHHFEAAPQHHYLVRSVDPVTPPLKLADAEMLLACGPFPAEAEEALLRDHRIDIIVAKNSGGTATVGKITAARRLKIPVVMIERQHPPGVETVHDVDAALGRLHHFASGDRKRGV